MTRPGRNLVHGVWLLASGFAYSGLSAAGSLDMLSGNWPENHLQASLDPVGTLQIEQGNNIRVRISADQEANVLLVIAGPDGRARFVTPHRQDSRNRVTPGSELIFPDLASGEVLYANMTLGKGAIYVLASSDPLPVATDDTGTDWLPIQTVESQLKSAIGSGPATRYAISRIPLRIVSSILKDFVSTEEFVEFFDVATRGVSNVERGFAVQFATNSAEITDFGRRQLDAVGRGMTNARLRNDRFLIEGHTDDTGSDEYNMALSRRRAMSVSRYLANLGVTPQRLKESAVGKAEPAMEGSSDAARDANRRVVIRRLDTER